MHRVRERAKKSCAPATRTGSLHPKRTRSKDLFHCEVASAATSFTARKVYFTARRSPLQRVRKGVAQEICAPTTRTGSLHPKKKNARKSSFSGRIKFRCAPVQKLHAEIIKPAGTKCTKKKRQKTFKNANAMQRRDRGPIPVGKNSALTLRRSGLRRCVCCDANSTRWIARPPSTSQCYKSIKIVPFQQHRKRMYRLPTLLHRIESTTQP